MTGMETELLVGAGAFFLNALFQTLWKDDNVPKWLRPINKISNVLAFNFGGAKNECDRS